VLKELLVLPLDEQVCPHCEADFDLFPETEDSDIIEINVKAYVRKIKRQRYHGKLVLPRKPSTSQSLLANSGHPAAVAV